jgi:hypothetical protein
MHEEPAVTHAVVPPIAAPLHILAVTDRTTRLEYVTKETVSSVTGARRLARDLGYRVCTVGGVCEMDTAHESPRWIITVHED